MRATLLRIAALACLLTFAVTAAAGSSASVSAPRSALPPDRQAVLQNFATMGITDTNLAPKPAYWDWKRLFERPLTP